MTSFSSSYKTQRNSSTSLENCDISLSTSSSFESENDSTSCSSRDKINVDPVIFENHILVATSDVKSVNSADFKDSFHEWNIEKSNLNVEFEHFIMPHTEDTNFTGDFTISSFVKEIVETSSGKISEKLYEILT